MVRTQQIRQLSNEQRAILNTIGMGICFTGIASQWANPSFASMFGYEPGELEGVDTGVFYSDPRTTGVWVMRDMPGSAGAAYMQRKRHEEKRRDPRSVQHYGAGRQSPGPGGGLHLGAP
jgi:PAS domain-containing protein